MNARKSMSLIGAAIVMGVGVTGPYALAGIDRGGKPDNGSPDTVSRGTVTGFGSVYVNGVRYRTDAATFLINGRLATEADLSVGQVVTVYGDLDEATGEWIALAVISENAVEGPIAGLNLSTGQMSVLGQTVHLNSDTAWSLANSGNGLEDLGAGDVVAISGYRNADGDIVATLVSDRLSDGDFDVTGAIGSVDPAATTFWIDGLSVDYGSANLFGLAGGMPAIGQRVDVTGATLTTTGQLLATSVAADADTVSAAAGTAAEVEGLVTSRSAWNEFDIDGTAVRFAGTTRFIDGSIFGLTENVKLEVEGRFDVEGVLIADSIRFEPASNLRAAGFVEIVGSDSFVIGGQRVFVTPETAWDDNSAEDDRFFRLSAIRSGDYLTVQGYRSVGGVRALRVEREESAPTFRIPASDAIWGGN